MADLAIENVTLRRAATLIAGGEHRGAHALCLAALQKGEAPAQALFLLALIAAEHRNPSKVLELTDKALQIESGHLGARAQRARALLALHRQAEARAEAEAAAALDPRDGHVLDTLGVVLSRTGAYQAAAALFRRATARRPDHADWQYNLGSALQFTGDLAGARTAYEAALKARPDHHRALSSLVSLSRQTEADNQVAALEALFDDADPDPDPDPARQQHLGHALAKSFEDMGDHPTALSWLERAKAGRRRAAPYAIDRDKALFEAAAATAKPATGGYDDPAPIFIVGLPRTGTTLLDRVLSSHPVIVSAGELGDFSLLVKRMTGTPSSLVLDVETFAAADRLDFAALGRTYVERARAAVEDGAGATAARVIDKMPLNVLNVGLIHRALPNARILCLRRHPVDSALSNYRQLFATDFPYYDYAFDLADAGRYYALFDRLVAHWRAILPPDRFAEVAYEDMVADLEGQTRRVLDLVGLPFDPACLAFHENTSAVSTASSVQVRSPLYSTSVGRWKRYGDGLQPLLDALRAEGIDIPD
ncbi:sulfotransferase [Brevundimonas sp.]|uniref:tetratricopeptide repeat-containing sulfotransferase family protein n=1 Tax=Brevundimonas sp. TaxID=1871086 RepID=UPI0037C172A8